MAGEGPSQARAHALNNIGTAKVIARYPEGMEELEESYALSADIHSSHDQIRAAVNISWAAIYYRDLAHGRGVDGQGPPVVPDREIASFDAYVTGELALIDEMRGNWAEAEAKVCFVLDTLAELSTANIVASTLLGRLQARRGEPDAKTHLMDGWERSLQAAEVQRTTPAAISLAEYVWIGGKLDEAIFPQMREILADCIERDSPWMAGELAYWLRLIGEIEDIPDIAPEPYRLAGDGDLGGCRRLLEGARHSLRPGRGPQSWRRPTPGSRRWGSSTISVPFRWQPVCARSWPRRG